VSCRAGISTCQPAHQPAQPGGNCCARHGLAYAARYQVTYMCGMGASVVHVEDPMWFPIRDVRGATLDIHPHHSICKYHAWYRPICKYCPIIFY
jgi:hypothetical protein